MRDGLRTLTDLVERIEGDGVVVDDVSLSRAVDEELAADISVRLRDGDSTAPPAEERGESDTDRSYRGETAEGTPTASDDDTISSDGGTTPVSGGTAPTNDGTALSNVGTTRTNGRAASKSRDRAGPVGVTPGFGALSASVGGSVAGSIADGLASVDRRRSNGAVAEAAASADESASVEGGTTGRNGGTPESGSASTSTDEPITCRVDGCEETFETDHGMKIHATKAHQADDGSAPSPHRDPERLQEVYEACDTFEEMTEALGVDVTPQTVRRSMMRLGVHDPNPDDEEPTGTGATRGPDEGSTVTSADRPRESNDDSTDESNVDTTDDSDDVPDVTTTGDPDGEPAAEPEEPAANADGSVAADVDELLPEAVDGEAFVAAVREGSTLYEVQRRLDMEREQIQTLLAEAGLLDLVHGRVATKGEREERKEEIERRIVERLGDRGGADSDERSGADSDDDSGEQRDGQTLDRAGEQAGAD